MVAIITSIVLRRMYRGAVNRIYLALACLELCTTVFDLFRCAPLSILGELGQSGIFRTVMCYSYLFLLASSMPLFMTLIALMTGTWQKLRRNAVVGCLFFIPLILFYILIILNIRTHWLFDYQYVNDELTYQQGTYMFVYELFIVYFLIYSLVWLLYTEKRMSFRKYIALLIIYPIKGFTIMMQILVPQMMVTMFGSALSMLIIAFFVFRADEDVDQETGARSLTSFDKDIENIFYTGEEALVLFVKIANDVSIRQMLEHRVYRDMIKRIAEVAEPLTKKKRGKKKRRSDFYYLHNGLFADIITGDNDSLLVDEEIEEISEKFKTGFPVDGVDIQLRVCFAGAFIPEDVDNGIQLRRFSENFHNMVQPWDLVMYSELAPDRDFVILNNIDRIVAKAIKEKRFQMYYQPIYSLKTKSFQTAEALIRLNDPELGFISPSIFIPAAEKNGQIIEIGDFVIEDVCRFISTENLAELGIDHIEVNLSVVQCMQGDMAEKIRKNFEKYKIVPGKIDFEITETAADSAYDTVLKTMNDISVYGGSFSLDDYGSGYSNLHRVMSFPYKTIKIDKSLTDEAEDEKKRGILLEAIHLIKSLDADIIVEGVETKEISDWFEANGCDFIQGFYYAKPMPEKEFIEFMKTRAV